MKRSNVLSENLHVPAAIVIGMAIALRPVDRQFLIPLLDTFAILRELGFIDFLKIVIAAAFLRFGMTSWIILLAVVEIAALWIARYSAVGAFYPQAAISGLFLLSILSLDREQTRGFATKVFSLIFLLAAGQKMNASYLAGLEFTSLSGFSSIAINFWGPLPRSLAVGILPWLSIVTEVALAIGLLWRPTLFSHLATIFILILALVHPPVLYVYFTAFFFLVLIDSKFYTKISTGRLASSVSSPFLWALASGVIAFMPVAFGQDAVTYFLNPWIITGLLLSIHGVMAWNARKESSDRSSWWTMADLDLRTAVAPKLVLYALVASFFAFRFGIAPTPIGFSMFSGSNQNASSYILEIEDSQACQAITRRLVVFAFTDVNFSTTGSGCKLAAPTESGRNSAIRQFCRDYPKLKFRLDAVETGCPGN